MNKASGGDGIPVELFQILEDERILEEGCESAALNMLSRLVITFLPRSKHLLISWLQSPSAVIGFEITQLEFHHLH